MCKYIKEFSVFKEINGGNPVGVTSKPQQKQFCCGFYFSFPIIPYGNVSCLHSIRTEKQANVKILYNIGNKLYTNNKRRFSLTFNNQSLVALGTGVVFARTTENTYIRI